MEVVALAFELSGCVDFVGHDPGDSLFHILHPLQHLGVTHVIHIFDEVVVLLPKSHLEAFGWLTHLLVKEKIRIVAKE